MFVTKLEDKLPDRFLSIDDGESSWRRVSMEGDNPYFLLRLDMIDGESWIGKTYLLSALGDVLDLCKLARDCPDIRIRQVAIISPPWMESDGGWRIHDLDEVKAGPIDRRGERTRMFKTKAGQRFVESCASIAIAPDAVNDLPIVFRSAWYEAED